MSGGVEPSAAARAAFIVPESVGQSAMNVYEAGLRSGVFLIQRCRGCSAHIFYPRVLCPHCSSPDLGWVEPMGLGTVYSTTVVRRPADKGGSYNVALVDLAEGVRLMTRVEAVSPEAVKIGMRVRVSVMNVNGVPAPVVHLLEGGEA